MTPTGPYMTAQQQLGSLFVCAFVVAMIVIGIWVIVRDIRGADSIADVDADIDDLCADLLLDRPLHGGDVRAAMGSRWSV